MSDASQLMTKEIEQLKSHIVAIEYALFGNSSDRRVAEIIIEIDRLKTSRRNEPMRRAMEEGD